MINYPSPITIEGTKKILTQMKTCIYRIDEYNGVGFFCILPNKKKNEQLKVFITNYHIINQNFIKNNRIIKISLNDNEKKNIYIPLDDDRKIFLDEEYDMTIIEIKENDKLYKHNNYLEIDIDINQIDEKLKLNDNSIYCIDYSNLNRKLVSFGVIKEVNDNNIDYLCNINIDSSNILIFNLLNNKIIGLHKETLTNNCHKGICLNYIIDKFNKNNEIKLTVKIEKEDLNKNIYFLDNTDKLLDENEGFIIHNEHGIK